MCVRPLDIAPGAVGLCLFFFFQFSYAVLLNLDNFCLSNFSFTIFSDIFMLLYDLSSDLLKISNTLLFNFYIYIWFDFIGSISLLTWGDFLFILTIFSFVSLKTIISALLK